MGVQAVYDVTVLLDWSLETLVDEFRTSDRAAFIVGNTRGMSASQARAVTAEIGANVAEASRRAERAIALISRGDSTLRGHYFEESQALAESTGFGDAPLVLAPYFDEGGRMTI